MKISKEQIAEVCHQVNKDYCAALGDDSQADWSEAEGWQKASAMTGVNLHYNGDHDAEASHVSWLGEKVNAGWVYGETKDAVAKTHPCLVPFALLPQSQQAKDFIFRAIVHALKEIDVSPQRKSRAALPAAKE